jgi:uncharacterized protein (UPF0333 family)
MNRIKNKIQSILKSESGISLIFVLAFMFLLLALGVSVLTAAGNSHRSVLAQRDRSQLTLYANSMEHVIHAALEEEGENTLTYYIYKTIFDHYFNAPGDIDGWSMEITAESPDEGAVYNITVKIKELKLYRPMRIEIEEIFDEPGDELESEPLFLYFRHERTLEIEELVIEVTQITEFQGLFEEYLLETWTIVRKQDIEMQSVAEPDNLISIPLATFDVNKIKEWNNPWVVRDRGPNIHVR